MRDQFDRILIASRPHESGFDAAFTDRVMRSVQPHEILSSQVRNMNVTGKETFIMKLRKLPVAAIIALALSGALLLGGTSYAVYKLLWEQPIITTQTPTKNQYGRTQVIAQLDKCGDQSSAATFEIKSGSTLDPSEIQKILQARCEMDVIDAAIGTKFDPSVPMSSKITTDKQGRQVYQDRMLSMVASKVVTIDKNNMTLTGDEYNTPKEPQILNDKTRYIVDNHIAKVSDIKPGDAVLFVRNATYVMTTDPNDKSRSSGGSPIHEVVTDVIKVNLPFEYYGPSKQNQIAERMPCEGNPQDSCVQGGSISLYENFGAGKQITPNENGEVKSGIRTIQGVLTEHAGNRFKIKSSSGRIFTFTLDRDIISNFNTNRSAEYSNTKIAVGDMVNSYYVVDESSQSTNLGADNIYSVELLINLIQKDDPIKKY